MHFVMRYFKFVMQMNIIFNKSLFGDFSKLYFAIIVPQSLPKQSLGQLNRVRTLLRLVRKALQTAILLMQKK